MINRSSINTDFHTLIILVHQETSTKLVSLFRIVFEFKELEDGENKIIDSHIYRIEWFNISKWYTDR